MIINDPNANISSAGAGATQPAAPNTASSSRGQSTVLGAGSDQFQLSDLSAKLRSLTADSPDFAAGLDRLTADFQAGTYQVDAGAISRGLVAESLNYSL